jgi:SAM-dependent methyltransferase
MFQPPIRVGAAPQMDSINRAAWRAADAVESYRRRAGWTDPGERGALNLVRRAASQQPILDLGVGAGRSVPLLREISSDYRALDYTEEMVAACRTRFPGVDVSHGDARDLSRFAAESFALVVFSFNGIDCVNRDDRQRVLREVFRVLRPGGHFVFSAHNIDGPGHDEPLSFGVDRTRNPFKLGLRVAAAAATAVQTLRNRHRLGKLREDGDGYSILNAAAEHHGVLIHYVSLQQQLKDLAEAGFCAEPTVFGNLSEQALSSGADTQPLWWFHFVAARPG